MSRRKCNGRTRHFRFDMPVNPEGVFCGNVTVEGFACRENGVPRADIDSVEYEGTEIKPVLELFGGMAQIHFAAANYVKDLFNHEHQLQEAA